MVGNDALVEALAARFSHLTQRDAEYAVKTLLDAKAPGIIGAITGRAIYEGTLDVAEAQAFCDSYKG